MEHRACIKSFIIALLFFIIAAVSATAQPRAYITGGNQVSVIDTGTNTVVTSIVVGNAATSAAVTPDGTKVYVTRRLEVGKVAVIQASTNTLLTTIDVGEFPSDVAISPDGTTAWVANLSFTGNNTVSRIDTSTDTVTDTWLPPVI